MLNYLTNVGRALSRLGNAIIGGHSGEMFSARVHRCNWLTLEEILNGLFFWEPDHCAGCYETEILDRDRPEEYRCPNLESGPLLDHSNH